MPLTFIDIERQKNWKIGIFFLFLLLIYFLITVIISQAIFFIFFIPTLQEKNFSFHVNSLKYLVPVIIFSILCASIHIFFSAYNAVRTIEKNLSAYPPDMEDGIHKQLLNVMEEINVVTGNKRKIRCMVIPSLSMNALAVEDLKGNAVIMITEGLLSRLTRPQLEGVIAHEAYHILSGDCMETTVAASIFGVYSASIEKLQNFSGGRIFLSPLFILAWILLQLSYLLNLFISREREYRADAGSVRLTRNPLALAEALNLISRNWRGTGFIGSGLEMLCILNPKVSELDESEGFFSDLLSTHPPVKKRISILLKMTRVSIEELQKRMEQRPLGKPVEIFYYALDPRQQWQGPFDPVELSFMPWFSPLTWVSDGNSIERAWRNPLFDNIFTKHLFLTENTGSDFTCPLCKQRLIKISYEKTGINQCRFCGGVLIENDKISRIIARREKPCTERVKSLAKAVLKENQIAYTRKKLRVSERKFITHMTCPKCKNPMTRKFYSYAYMIEIDTCSLCQLTWFENDELEMLQCLIENRIIAGIEPLYV